MNWIRNLKFSTKLLAIMALLVAPTVLLSVFFFPSVQGAIATAHAEEEGAHYYHPIEEMLSALGNRMTNATAVALGDRGATAQVDSSTAEIDKYVAEMDAEDAQYGRNYPTSSRMWQEAKSQWQRVKTQTFTDPDASRSAHTELAEKLLAARAQIANETGITLDPSPVNFYLLDIAVMQIPQLDRYVGSMEEAAVTVVMQGKVDFEHYGEHRRAQAALNLTMETIDSHRSALSQLEDADADVKQLVSTTIPALREAVNQYVQSVETDVYGSSVRIGTEEILKRAEEMNRVIGEVHDIVQARADKGLDEALATAAKQRNLALTVTGLALLLGMLFAGAVIYTTSRELGRAVNAVSRMAEGDYSETVEASGRDEISSVLKALSDMQNRLGNVLQSVRSSATEVATAAREINQGTTDLADRTEKQAANLEETAASMEEMTSTVKQNADNADHANQLALAAREQAEQGGAVVRKAVDAMAGISASSRKIADIIAVVDEIAFQTNLLALNASVEAARAGDQGRGFAVVASEVRNLAQRSATSAREIKLLIEDSVSKVEAGSQLVTESGKHLSDIVGSVKKVSDIIGEITAAGREQARGADEVNRAVMEMDQGTQQNAAMVEQATAASASMNDQASKLQELVAFFRLDTEHAASTAAQDEVSVPAAPAKSRAPERRSGKRPWSNRKSAAPAAGSGNGGESAAPAKASGGEDWSEF